MPRSKRRKKREHSHVVAIGEAQTTPPNALTDMLGSLDEVQNLLDQAPSQESACLEGIRRADSALRQCPQDVGLVSSLKMKRAELFFVAARKEFNTSAVSGQYSDPLRSCVTDCEYLLEHLSEVDPASRDLYAEASDLLSRARLISDEDDDMIEVRRRTKPVNNTYSAEANVKRPPTLFDPDKTMFREVSKINKYLLQDVANCYRRAALVCRVCFYQHRRQEKLGRDRLCHHCQKVVSALVLIPASVMCKNLFHSSVVAIPTAPRMLMTGAHRTKPFTYCQSGNHASCLSNAATGEVWFAHSIEELVIWTVERHYKCSFQEYIDQLHRDIPLPFSSGAGGATSNGPTSGRQESTVRANSTSKERLVVKYDAETFHVPDVASIPAALLHSIFQCYQSAKEYCKYCFYKSNRRYIVSLGGNGGQIVCSHCQRTWDPVLVVPRSKLCSNFGDFEFVPIAPLPDGKPTYDPFEYCLKQDHYRCFRVYIDSGFWYTHSVEEMVVWTVEREKGCSFNEFIRSVKATAAPKLDPPNVLLPTPSYAGTATPASASQHKLKLIPSIAGSSTTVFQLSEVNFSSVNEIPTHLIQSVGSCFSHQLEVCRKCFYGERCLSSLIPHEGTCNTGQHQWANPIRVIPGCELCDNAPCFQRGDYVAVPPLPPVAVIKKCGSVNHHKCFGQAMQFDSRLAHSVEELVVWLVESETDVNFIDYVATIVNIPEETYHAVTPAASSSVNVSKSTAVVVSTAKPPSAATQPIAKYDAKNAVFNSTKDIPFRLLSAVAACFKNRMLLCRECFFKSARQVRTTKKANSNTCEKKHAWREVMVIPNCTLCKGPGPFIPIFNLPLHMSSSRSPFILCNKPDHAKCFSLSWQNDPWFPHTVEEMVIWTVERELSCQFEDVYKSYLEQATAAATAITQPKTTVATPPGPMAAPLSTISHDGSVFPQGLVSLGELVPQQSQPAHNSNFLVQTTASYQHQHQPIIQRAPHAEAVPVLYEEAPGGAPTLMDTLTQVDDSTMPTFDDASQIFPSLLSYGSEQPDSASQAVGASSPFVVGTEQYQMSFPSLRGEVSTSQHHTSPTQFLGRLTPHQATPPQSHVPSQYPSTPLPANADDELLLSMAAADSQLLNQFPQMQHAGQDYYETVLTEGVAGSSETELWPDLTAGSSAPAPNVVAPNAGSSQPAAGSTGSLDAFIRDHISDQIVVPGRQGSSNADTLPLSSGLSAGSSQGFTMANSGGGLFPASVDVPVGYQMLGSQGSGSSPLLLVSHSTGPQPVESELALSDAEPTLRAPFSSDHSLSTFPQASGPVPDSSDMQYSRESVRSKHSSQRSSHSSGEIAAVTSAGGISRDNLSNPNLMISSMEINSPYNSSAFGVSEADPYFSSPKPNSDAREVTGHDLAVGGYRLPPSVKKDDLDSFGEDIMANSTEDDFQFQAGLNHGEERDRSSNVPCGELLEFTERFTNVQLVDATHGEFTEMFNNNNMQLYEAAYKCRLCYVGFESAVDMAAHVRGSEHSGRVLLDSGGELLWRHPPPPPHTSLQTLLLCQRPEACDKGLSCGHAHSPNQLSEWRERCGHRSTRKGQSSIPGLSNLSYGLQLSLSKELSEYGGVSTKVSAPLHATVSTDEGQFLWTITLEGEDWQSLFGICCDNKDFHITRLDWLDISRSPQSSQWEAASTGDIILLGSVAFTVRVTFPAKAKQHRCRVSLNVGFEPYLYLELQLSVEDLLPQPPTNWYPDPQLELTPPSPNFSDPGFEDIHEPPQHNSPVQSPQRTPPVLFDEKTPPDIEPPQFTLEPIPSEEPAVMLSSATSQLGVEAIASDADENESHSVLPTSLAESKEEEAKGSDYTPPAVKDDDEGGWSSDSSEGELRIEPEDYTLLHVPMEDSLGDEDTAFS